MRKEKGAKPAEVKTPDDTTAAIIAEFNEGKPDFFLTSGHATERDWQIGYSYKNGQFRCQEGRVFGIDVANKPHAMESPNPKVYLASGNCRMGLVPDCDAMAVAFIHSGGVHQMIGYVVSTWYGAAGWGTRDYFMTAGMPLADAAFANEQWMVWQLESRFPKSARVQFETYDIESNGNLPNDLAKKHGLVDKDEVGLLWDRDTLAFYGDPAWVAQMAVKAPLWTSTLTEKEGVFTFEAVSTIDGDWPRPPFAFLPRRVKGLKVVEGVGLAADDFVMLATPGKMTKGQKVRAVFSAK
jgi:zinc protease